MKINFKSKKFIIPIIIVVIVLVVASVLGYRYYQEQELQKKIDTAITEIEKTETDFNKEDTREDKLALLQSVSKEHTDYEKSKDMIKEIDEKYHSVISDMQKVFREEYDKTLTDNTLKDIDKISDKEQLNNAKTKLNELLQTIQNEKDIVCTENEVKEYETKITDLVKSYEDRVTAIEKEEQAKKEAEEKKAKEEAERQAAQQNSQSQSSSGNSSYSSGGSNSSSGSNSSTENSQSSNSGGGAPYIVETRWYTDANGTCYTYYYSDGSIWYKDYDGSMHDITNNPDIWG